MKPTSSELVQVENISVVIGRQRILHDVSLSLQAGSIVSVIGPNGAGKSTLVKVIVGLIAPTDGKVHQAKGLRIGYMPQRIQVDPFFPLTVHRFLELGHPKVSLDATLKEVGIKSELLSVPLSGVSGGELQRILLARALLRRPQLLVLDEPVQGVDLIGQGELYDLIASIRHRYHCAILLVSHDLNVVMAQTDVVVCLNQHICCSGNPDMVSRDPAFTALFGDFARHLAFYTHRHDHHHGVHGEVVKGRADE